MTRMRPKYIDQFVEQVSRQLMYLDYEMYV
jgi:hypothetical protein